MVSSTEGLGRRVRCGRALVGEGDVKGRVVKVEHHLSFLGEVDPRKGVLYDGRSIKNKVLVVKGIRGSTVGSYVIYALRYYGNAPLAVVVEGEADPIVVAGCVMAELPLVDKTGSLELWDGDLVFLQFVKGKACISKVGDVDLKTSGRTVEGS